MSPMPWRSRQPIAAALRRAQRLGDERVVVDRHHVAADRAQQRRERAGGEQHAGARATRAARSRARHAVAAVSQRSRRRVLVDPHARRARRPRAARRTSFAGSTSAAPGAVHRPPRYVGECDLGPRRRRRRARSTSWPKRRSSSASSSSHASSCGSSATAEVAGGSSSQSIPWRSRSAGERRRSSRARAARALASRPGTGQRRWRSRASASDCRKPPLRPLAPWPSVSPSSTTTSRPGSSALACSAAHSPVKPPPTMHRSASIDPPAAARASRGGERVAARTAARSASA